MAKNEVKQTVSKVKNFGKNSSIGGAIATGVVVGSWQFFQVGEKIQAQVSKIPVVGKMAGNATAGVFSSVAGITGLYLRRSKGMNIEKGVYAALLINGVIDVSKSLISKIKR